MTSVVVSELESPRLTSTTMPSTAAPSSGADVRSCLPREMPALSSTSRTVACDVRMGSTDPSTATCTVLTVDTRTASRSSTDERDADVTAPSPRGPSAASSSPTVCAVVGKVVSSPSISTVTSRLVRTTTSPPSRADALAAGCTRSSGPTGMWW